MPTERLQKIIAQAGIASRRKSETLISEGRVRLNGRIVTELGTKADPLKDKIEVNGRRIVRERQVYVLLHKPKGTVTTATDPEERKTVLSCLKGRVKERVFPVGRLDYNTSGALLLTNDGELAEALAHPRAQAKRVYRARLSGQVTAEQLDQLRDGVELEDGPAKAYDAFIVNRSPKSTTVQLALKEGRNHQIHRMAEAIGHRVARLSRVSFAGLDVEGLAPGEFRTVRARELARLKRDFVNPSRAKLKGPDR